MVIILKTLYNNFEIIIISLLKTKNKLIYKILSIFNLKKVKNLSK